MSAALLLAVLCGPGRSAFALEEAPLRAPLVTSAGLLLLPFGALPAWLLPAHAGGR